MSRAELEEQRQFLLDSLRDLEREREAGEIAEEDYESLRDDYTARAAEVLRQLEEYETQDAALPKASAFKSRKMTAVILIVGFIVVAITSVLTMSGGRNPGAPITGSIPETNADRLALAHALESQGQAVEALKQYDAVLREDPNNVEALTYRGWLLRLAGLTDQAQAALDKAIGIDSRYPDAHFFLGILLFRDRNDPAAAIPQFEAFLASNPPPETVPEVQRVLDQARQAVTTTTTAP